MWLIKKNIYRLSFFFQTRYPIMVKCLNIGKNIGKPIYRPISSLYVCSDCRVCFLLNAWLWCMCVTLNLLLSLKRCNNPRSLMHDLQPCMCCSLREEPWSAARAVRPSPHERAVYLLPLTWSNAASLTCVCVEETAAWPGPMSSARSGADSCVSCWTKVLRHLRWDGAPAADRAVCTVSQTSQHHCTACHIKSHLILHHIRNPVLSYFYSSKSTSEIYLRTRKYHVWNVLKVKNVCLLNVVR